MQGYEQSKGTWFQLAVASQSILYFSFSASFLKFWRNKDLHLCLLSSDIKLAAALPQFFCTLFLGISSISFCGFSFTWQTFSGELYGRPLFLPLTFSERTPGEAKSSLIISQAGSVPLLYLSARLISQEWKAALQWAGEERHGTNQKATKNQCGHIHGHIWKS